MNYEPLVSIIIPVYNGGEFLSQAIESALNQTYKKVEIIVVNDGSNDDGESEKIALSYNDKIRYFTKENGGVSTALNYAMKIMKGEWFSWLSHDDLYFPEKIQKQIEYINYLKDNNQNINIKKITIRSATQSIDKNGKVIYVPSYKDVPECEEPIDTIINNVFRYRLSGCSFLLPSSCIKDAGFFDPHIRTVSDVEYWYRLLFSGYKFYCLKSEILVKNRSHGQQVGKNKVNLFNKELNELFINISDSINKVPLFNSVYNFEKYYLALKKRKCKKASIYVKNKYLKNSLNKFSYYIKLPILAFYYNTIGTLRNIVRDIYRKKNVK